MLIKPELSCLLVVDVQARLAPAVAGAAPAIANIARLMRAAARLDIPVLVAEEYPQGLGPTVPELAALAPAGATMAKTHFACTREPDWRRRFAALGRPQIVVAGMEAHVCVLQTALTLLDDGYRPFLVADATASRRPEDRELAIERLRAAGVAVVTTEMVVFEWLERADTPAFRELLALIK